MPARCQRLSPAAGARRSRLSLCHVGCFVIRRLDFMGSISLQQNHEGFRFPYGWIAARATSESQQDTRARVKFWGAV